MKTYKWYHSTKYPCYLSLPVLISEYRIRHLLLHREALELQQLDIPVVRVEPLSPVTSQLVTKRLTFQC